MSRDRGAREVQASIRAEYLRRGLRDALGEAVLQLNEAQLLASAYGLGDEAVQELSEMAERASELARVIHVEHRTLKQPDGGFLRVAGDGEEKAKPDGE